MTITKNSLIMMIFFLTIERCLTQSANSQQPTANSQQPTANSQILTKTIFYFTSINLLIKRAVSEFGAFSHFILWLLFFYVYLAVRQAYVRCFLAKTFHLFTL